jgi:Uma2 family endonuclease
MTELKSNTTCTASDYLDWERQQPLRHEYINGDIYAMTGASRQHNLICGNLLATLHQQLRGKPCEVYASDLRVKVNETGMYTYPDVVVACADLIFEDQQVDTLINPLVLIEVLSPSTEHYDRGAKFLHYRQLSSLRDYLLVSQHDIRIEHYTRQAAQCWLLTEYQRGDEVIALAAIGCVIMVRDVYERIYNFTGTN